jgi:rhodanese-related sulfurtransferase
MGRHDVITPADLLPLVGQSEWPRIVDVRRAEVGGERVPAAVRRDHRSAAAWAGDVAGDGRIVVYCVHGEQFSRSAVTLLRAEGIDAVVIEGGMDAWRGAGGPVVAEASAAGLPTATPSRWVTRERPKIDRIACPWLLRRFIDADARIHFVEASSVAAVAAEIGGVPFDVPGVDFSHDGDGCSFDAFIARFAIVDPVLERLAVIVRGADTGRLDLAPQCAGLLAVSLGLSATCDDDAEMMRRGFGIYDSLYGWLRLAAGETHGWSEKPAR